MPFQQSTSKLQLTLACGNYDRTWPLRDGRVIPEGMDLNYLALGPEEIFWRMLTYAEFDISEMSLSSYVLNLSQDKKDFIAIPVFPSRMFRHSFIFVNKHANILEPDQLKGKRIGVPEYQITAAVWIRGILEDEYNVHPSECIWYTGGLEEPGRKEKLPLDLPGDIQIENLSGSTSLSQALESGEIDALITARLPSCFNQGSPNVERLFKNHKQVEQEYYLKTGIFPIMHTVVIKKKIYEQNPWIAKSLFKAFNKAKEISVQEIIDFTTPVLSLPNLVFSVEESLEIFGEDFWPYGLQKNKETLQKFLQYSYKQGLSRRQFGLTEIFAPETIDDFKI